MMKRSKNLFGIILFLIVFFSAAALSAGEFRVQKGGGVEADGKVFSSVREYVQSDYFRETGKRCGVRRLEGVADARLEKSMAHCTSTFTSIQGEYWPSMVYEVPVWWHVIYRSDGYGNVSDSRIQAQMQALNEDYRAMMGTMGANGFDVKIQFVLAGIDRTMNNEWFTDSYNDEEAYKKALGKDTTRYVNVYTNDAGGYLGYAYYPQNSAGRWWDGIVLLHDSVGGRNNNFSPYDQGRTLVHEMGHYLGLLHTFQGGCTNSYSTGDLIVDTNAEAEANFDGSVPVTSCGTPDPVHNYMNYVKDIYMWEFTSEQANRAVCSLVNYRPNVYAMQNAFSPAAAALLLLKGEPETKFPTAAITIDGSADDWSSVPVFAITKETTAVSGAQIENLKFAYSQDLQYLYVLVEVSDAVSTDVVYRFFFDNDGNCTLVDEDGNFQFDIETYSNSPNWSITAQEFLDPALHSGSDSQAVVVNGIVSVNGQYIEAQVDAAALNQPDASMIVSGRTMDLTVTTTHQNWFEQGQCGN